MGTFKPSFRLKELLLVIAILPLAANAQQPVRPHLEKGFVANRGQVQDQFRQPNPDVLFLWAGRSGMNVQVHANGLSYDTYAIDPQEEQSPVHFHRIDMRMLGTSEDARVTGERPRGGKLNFSGWGSNGKDINDVPHFSTVRYTGIYPGVDMELSLNGTGGNAFKYDFILHPGAEIDHIRLRFDGFDSAAVKDGTLDFMLSGRHLTESIPHSWTVPGNDRVEVHYRVIEQAADHLVVGLELADAHERLAGRTLVIDPDPVVQWSTYYGSTAFDAGNAITTDTAGYIYMAGSTLSIDNIATGQGLYEAGFVGGQDVFLMKFLHWGVVDWCTYYGGESWDMPVGLKVNVHNHLYVVGNTNSALGIASIGAQQDSLAGDTDAFVARFDTLGHRIWGTYLGGALKDSAAYCALDSYGGLLVVGTTWSAGFNADSLPALNGTAGGADAFVVHIDSSGQRKWTTFFGGPGDEVGNGINWDSTGVWIAGSTTSASGIATAGIPLDSLRGSEDAFVAKLDTVGLLEWASYFGGDSIDRATSVAVVGNAVFITGVTFSPGLVSDSTAHQMNYGGGGDVFIARFDSGGVQGWTTYLGDSLYDRPSRIVRDPGGQVRVVGTTASPVAMATSDVLQPSLAGGTDAFLTKFDTTGHRLWGTYFGGGGDEVGADLAMFNVNIMFITGSTNSQHAMYELGAQEIFAGGISDAFISRIFQEGLDPGDSTCSGGGNSGGGGSNGGSSGTGDPDSTMFYPDTLYICMGDTLRITFGPNAVGTGFKPVWYEDRCGDPRYFLGKGDTLVLVPTDTMDVYLRGENIYRYTACRRVIVVVDPYPIPIITASQGECLGDTVHLTASGGHHYEWTGPNGFASEDEVTFDVPSLPGDSLVYRITAFSQHAGCTASDSVVVQVLPAPNVGFSITDASCFGASDGAVELAPLDTIPLIFLWPAVGSSEPSVHALPAGSYVVITSNAQCSRTDTIVVDQPAYPIDSVVVQASLCGESNGSATLVMNSASLPYIYVWSVPGEDAHLGGLLAGPYQVKVTDGLGCAYTEEFVVQDLGSLTASTTPDSILITVGDSLQIQAWVVPLDSGTTFSWSPEEHLECTQCLHPFAKPDSTVWYVFTAVSAYGCVAADSVLVMVYHPCPELFVPTVFSPNNDGLNDGLCVMGGCIQEFTFTIWDRWNAEVFHTENMGRCWDGTYRGQPLSGGAFRYLLNVVHTDGTAVEQAGEILIKR